MTCSVSPATAFLRSGGLRSSRGGGCEGPGRCRPGARVNPATVRRSTNREGGCRATSRARSPSAARMSIRTRRGDPVSRRRATVFDVSGTTPPEWRSYQELTEELMRRLGAADGITTLRLEREVPVSGRANDNCIDVLWEVEGVSGERVRLLFECRSYKRRINQQALHSWRSIVDDVSEPGVETIGVMVTTTGYQSGAQRVADTYGIVILELRAPTERDLANRWRSARIELVSRMPPGTGRGRGTAPGALRRPAPRRAARGVARAISSTRTAKPMLISGLGAMFLPGGAPPGQTVGTAPCQATASARATWTPIGTNALFSEQIGRASC